MTTVSATLREAAHTLANLSDSPRLDAELLMADALGVSRSDLLLWHMDAAPPSGFTDHLNRRREQEPVAYIIGEAEFFGRVFAVKPGVLIPRADSETLIEEALERIIRGGSEARVLDMGTGSGALLLTLLAERPLWSGIAIDASETALAVARQNAASLDLEDRASVRAGDWTKAGWADDLGTFDLIVCNPPYVEEDAPLDRDVRDYEPASALFSGPEGLDDYRVLIPQLRKLMNREGVAILEIGATQADAVGQIAEKAGFRCSVRRDLANRPRVVSLS